MNTLKFTLPILLISLIAFACKNNGSHSSKKNKNIEYKEAKIVSDFRPYEEKHTPLAIDTAFVKDSIMTIIVNYSGGCQTHEFDLIGSQFIQKSMPPQRGIRLINNANGDDCRELIHQTLYFNITDFQYPGGQIHLNLDGYKHPLIYNSISEE